MANTIAKALGIDKTRIKEVHRLGSCAAQVEAATWNTFVVARVNADGSGYVRVTQNGLKLVSHEFGPEDPS